MTLYQPYKNPGQGARCTGHHAGEHIIDHDAEPAAHLLVQGPIGQGLAISKTRNTTKPASIQTQSTGTAHMVIQ